MKALSTEHTVRLEVGRTHWGEEEFVVEARVDMHGVDARWSCQSFVVRVLDREGGELRTVDLRDAAYRGKSAAQRDRDALRALIPLFQGLRSPLLETSRQHLIELARETALKYGAGR